MILERIARETGLSVEKIAAIVRSATYRYKTYTIPKRTGGHRTISQPTPALKFIQRWLCRNVLSYCPIHEAAAAYRKGLDISSNARLHVKHNYLLKIDFENFFPSITSDDVRNVLDANRRVCVPRLGEEDIEVIVKAVCKDGALSIGAPSSPMLSNIMMYEFDRVVFEECQRRRVKYSRYADDIGLSTNVPDQLAVLLEFIRRDLRYRNSPALKINTHKTVFTSRKRRRMITGIILTSDGHLSIGRQAKRALRSRIYRYSAGMLSEEEISSLRGYLAFVNSVEPELISRLRPKYGPAVIERLMSEDIVSRKNMGL